MKDNIPEYIRSMCRAQEAKIKSLQQQLGQTQLATMSVSTLAAQYKVELDKLIRILEPMIDANSVLHPALNAAKKIAEMPVQTPADMIMRLSVQTSQLRNSVASYQTQQERMEAEIKELKETIERFNNAAKQ